MECKRLELDPLVCASNAFHLPTVVTCQRRDCYVNKVTTLLVYTEVT
jgi:hypothetical protein